MTTTIPASTASNTTAHSEDDNNNDSSSSSSASLLHHLLLTPNVDWRHFEERLENHQDEARILNAQGWSVLQVLLAKRPKHVAAVATDSSSCYSPKRQPSTSPSPPSPLSHLPLRPSRLVHLVERLLLIFPEAAWLGIDDSYSSPLHLACRFNPTLLLFNNIILHARPAVLPFDQQALLYLWEYHVQQWGNGNSDLLVASFSNHIKYRKAHFMEGYIGDSSSSSSSSIKTTTLSCDNHHHHQAKTVIEAYQQLVTVLYYVTTTGDHKNNNNTDNDNNDFDYYHDPWSKENEYDDDDYYYYENEQTTATTTTTPTIPKCCWTRVVNPCFFKNDCTFLHRVASLTTDLDFLRLALSSSSSSSSSSTNGSSSSSAHQVADVDYYNRLPMHCFLANPPHTRRGGPRDDDDDDNFDGFIFDLIPLFDILHQANPQALQIKDALGMLPLHIAIQNGWSEQLVMDRLVYHYPESLECPVTVHHHHNNNNNNQDTDESNHDNNKKMHASTKVLPFQLAALTPTTSLSTVYRLVRQDPRIAVDAFRSSSSFSAPSLPKVSSHLSKIAAATVLQRPPSATTTTTTMTTPQLPLLLPLSTSALCQFVKAVGEQHNFRLWRTMNVLLTATSCINKQNTVMSAAATNSTAAVLLPDEEEEEEEKHDRFKHLQHYLLTIASPR